MKKPYQIESQRAVKQLAAMAADGNPAVQMMCPWPRWWTGCAKKAGADAQAAPCTSPARRKQSDRQ